MASNLGTVFVELSLDDKVYKQKLSETLMSTQTTAKGAETAWKALGVKSDAVFEANARAAQNAYTLIKNSATSSANDIIRAEEAKNTKIQQLNDQQFGKQTSMIDGLKAHWIAASAVIYSAWSLAQKGMNYVEFGAKSLQAEESFRRVAASAGESADDILKALKRVSVGTIDESGLMQKAVKGMVLGLSGNQMVQIMQAARVSARVTGEDVKTAYENITDAIATGLPKALKRYGLITKEEMAAVNAALKAGVEDVNLYSLAMLNAGVQASKFGDLQLSTAEKLQKYRASVQDAREETGKFLISIPAMLAKLSMPYIEFGAPGFYVDTKKADEAENKGAEAYAAGLTNRKRAAGIWYENQKASELALLKAKTEAAILTAGELKKINEEIRKNAFEIDSVGKSQYDKDLIRIREEVDKYKKAGIDKVTIAKYTAGEIEIASRKDYEVKRKDAQDAEKEAIAEMERAIARGVALSEKHIRGAEEYRNIVADEYDFAATENERAINKIIHQEREKVNKVNEILALGAISFQAAEDAKAQIHKNAQAAIIQKEQNDAKILSGMLVTIYSEAPGYGKEAYDEKLKLITLDAEALLEAGGTWDDAWVMIKSKQNLAYIAMGEKNPDFLTGVEAAFLKVKERDTTWGKTGNAVAQSFVDGAEKQLADNFVSIFTGKFDQVGIKWTELWGGMVTTFSQQLAKMVIEADLPSSVVKLTFKAVTSGNWSDVLGLVNKVWGFVNNVTGGGSPGTEVITGDFRASGGPVSAQKPVWVGEKGAELLFLGGPGYVMEHNQSMAYSARNGGYIPGRAEGGGLEAVNYPAAIAGGYYVIPSWYNFEVANYGEGNVAAPVPQEWRPVNRWGWEAPERATGTWINRQTERIFYGPEAPTDLQAGTRWLKREDSSFFGSEGPIASILAGTGDVIHDVAGPVITALAIAGLAIAGNAVGAGLMAGEAAGAGTVAGAGAAGSIGTATGLTAAEMVTAGATVADMVAYGFTAAEISAGYVASYTSASALLGRVQDMAIKYGINYALSQLSGGPGGMNISAGMEGDLSGVARAMGGIAPRSDTFGFSARNGLDYVPYDNFPARLHKGERVQTAEEAASRGPVHIHLEMNGREIAYAIADEAERNPRLKRRLS